MTLEVSISCGALMVICKLLNWRIGLLAAGTLTLTDPYPDPDPNPNPPTPILTLTRTLTLALRDLCGREGTWDVQRQLQILLLRKYLSMDELDLRVSTVSGYKSVHRGSTR